MLANSTHRFYELREKLHALGPDNVMSRGFSVLRTGEGKIITRAQDLKVGDMVEALLRSGKVKLKVESIEMGSTNND